VYRDIYLLIAIFAIGEQKSLQAKKRRMRKMPKVKVVTEQRRH